MNDKTIAKKLFKKLSALVSLNYETIQNIMPGGEMMLSSDQSNVNLPKGR